MSLNYFVFFTSYLDHSDLGQEIIWVNEWKSMLTPLVFLWQPHTVRASEVASGPFILYVSLSCCFAVSSSSLFLSVWILCPVRMQVLFSWESPICFLDVLQVEMCKKEKGKTVLLKSPLSVNTKQQYLYNRQKIQLGLSVSQNTT